MISAQTNQEGFDCKFDCNSKVKENLSLLSDLYTVETGQWNGMISNAVNGEADIITAALTKCCKRTEVLDFFGSFLKQSLGFVIKRKCFNQSGIRSWVY